MNILVLAQYFPPDMGGGATRAYNIAKGLAMAGCNVTVVCAFPHYPTGNIPKKYRKKLVVIEYVDNLKIIRTYVPPIASEGVFKRLLLFASFVLSSSFAYPSVGKLDGVFASNPNIISVLPSFVYCKFNKCPLVQNVDDLWPEALFDLGLDKNSSFAYIGQTFANVSYNLAYKIVPISPAYVKIIKGKYNIDPVKRIFVVPAGVDLSNFSNKPQGGKDRFTVLYIGAFSPAYDFSQIFKAAELLKNENISFIIQGGGELAATLKKTVDQFKLTNVLIIEKIVSRKEVAQILQEADALILPLNGLGSIELGISSKLYEYQAAGKPIICCSNGQAGKYVLDTHSGLVVKPGDYKFLCDTILRLKQNPSFSEQLGKNGADYVQKNLSIEKIGERIKQLFIREK